MSTSVNEFASLQLAEKLVGILDSLGYRTPTPIQAQAIPVVLKGDDVLGIAQTGTGKTFAFGLPMLQRIAREGGSGLVLAPTRELAIQIQESLMKVGSQLRLRTALLIGGAPMDRQRRDIQAKPHVIIATPGRLVDHLEQRTISLSTVSVFVLDEADRMLDMGFKPQLDKIVSKVPAQRQTLLFSATMPADILKIAHAWMKTPVHIEIARAGTTADTIQQQGYFVTKDQKIALLHTLLTQRDEKSVLVFSRTKHGAKKLAATLRAGGHTAVEIHANRTLAQRRAALDGFKKGSYRVLVATDIAARGIDVQGIGLVVNFDLPDALDDYVHRIGRTGRAGRKGNAMSFILPDQRRDVQSIERLTKARIDVLALPELLPTPVVKHAIGDSFEDREPRRFGSSSRSRSHASFGQRSPYSAARSASPDMQSRGDQRPASRPSSGGPRRRPRVYF